MPAFRKGVGEGGGWLFILLYPLEPLRAEEEAGLVRLLELTGELWGW